MKNLLSTKEVAKFLGVNEKMIYTLISEKGLPATKVTGKWLFPAHLVEQWIETRTMNYPQRMDDSCLSSEVLVVAGSNDILFDKMLKLFMEEFPDMLAAFSNLGSLGGIKAVKRGLCQMATSHLMDSNEADYNFSFAAKELEEQPAVVNFCYREQGLVVAKGNPKGIHSISDMLSVGAKMVNRPLGTGTRLLFDTQLSEAGGDPNVVDGYAHEVARHLDVGLEILSGKADVGLAIHAVAGQLDLGFIPLQWERYDLIIPKKHFFDKNVQLFLSLLGDNRFHEMATELPGYETSRAGRVLYPGEGGQP